MKCDDIFNLLLRRSNADPYIFGEDVQVERMQIIKFPDMQRDGIFVNFRWLPKYSVDTVHIYVPFGQECVLEDIIQQISEAIEDRIDEYEHRAI